jgi:hypothetical protein
MPTQAMADIEAGKISAFLFDMTQLTLDLESLISDCSFTVLENYVEPFSYGVSATRGTFPPLLVLRSPQSCRKCGGQPFPVLVLRDACPASPVTGACFL